MVKAVKDPVHAYTCIKTPCSRNVHELLSLHMWGLGRLGRLGRLGAGGVQVALRLFEPVSEPVDFGVEVPHHGLQGALLPRSFVKLHLRKGSCTLPLRPTLRALQPCRILRVSNEFQFYKDSANYQITKIWHLIKTTVKLCRGASAETLYIMYIYKSCSRVLTFTRQRLGRGNFSSHMVTRHRLRSCLEKWVLGFQSQPAKYLEGGWAELVMLGGVRSIRTEMPTTK